MRKTAIGSTLLGFTIAAALFGAAAAEQAGDTLSGTATAQSGDSLRLGGRLLRLWGIRASEAPAPLGRESADALAQILSGGKVTCEVVGQGEEPSLAVCRIGESDVATELIRQGWAGVTKAQADRRLRLDLVKRYDYTQIRARNECRGLWQALERCRQK